jgi:high-affinity nickel-transport protein
LSGAFWDAFRALGQHFNLLGFLIIGLFAASWAGSWVFYRLQRLDEIEVILPS